MAHHAYVVPGSLSEGIARARAFARELLPAETADIAELAYNHFSVEDARSLSDIAHRAPTTGERKVIIVSTGRLFHAAQNALLKIFEEPPEHTTLLLVVPSLGQLLPTLRSRLIALPSESSSGVGEENDRERLAREFLEADQKGREKMVGKIADAAKSDKEDVKQRARLDALSLAEGLLVVAYQSQVKRANPDTLSLMADLEKLIPVLHEASAPLKQVLEHVVIITPSSLTHQ